MIIFGASGSDKNYVNTALKNAKKKNTQVENIHNDNIITDKNPN
jgi:hypothetical protein